jgi:5-methylcytosine-specific restriction endonuclease McrA
LSDKHWHDKTAAKRLGIALEDYLQRKASGLKHCRRCREWRQVAMFGVDVSRGDGRASICGLCKRKPRQLKLIPRSPAEYARHRYATDVAFRLRRKLRRRGRQDIGVMPPEGAAILLETFGGLCAYCRVCPGVTWDHIRPVSDGGRTEPGNMLPACKSCNSRKKDRSVYDFIERSAIDVSPELEDALALAVEKGHIFP